MTNIDLIADEVRQELQEDYVGLWVVVRRVLKGGDNQDPNEVRKVVLGVLTKLLERGDLSVGIFEAKRFVEWDEKPEGIVSRVENAWLSLGRMPNIGEICWLAKKPVSQPDRL